ncbi:protein-ADP-ribose hydrolase [Cohnella boryungensis]|uniref:Protein-ADP-ribose hydrolase n=1 Tax=Cohnella boryungensis TaxID=768479 RepID=A0ABV8SGU7_9BACL
MDQDRLSTLRLSVYRSEIDLDEPLYASVEPQLTEEVYLASLEAAVELLQEHTENASGQTRLLSRERKRAYLKAALTVMPPEAVSEKLHGHVDRLLQFERQSKAIANASDLVPASKRFGNRRIPAELVLWQGDITELAADAIVNAANNALLGCFQPFHACIDNAIHSAAGPRLREDCNRIMKLQGHSEPTGHAKITRAYHLPSAYVLHTVGPIVPAGSPVTERHRMLLANCYTSCLSLAAQIDSIRSIAFCAISTGVFGYPKAEAAELAVREVTNWLKQNPGRFDRIIYNAFSDEDRRIYESVLKQ